MFFIVFFVVLWIILLMLLMVMFLEVMKVRLMVEMFGVGMCIVVLFSLFFRFGRILFRVLVVLVEVGIIVIVVECV